MNEIWQRIIEALEATGVPVFTDTPVKADGDFQAKMMISGYNIRAHLITPLILIQIYTYRTTEEIDFDAKLKEVLNALHRIVDIESSGRMSDYKNYFVFGVTVRGI